MKVKNLNTRIILDSRKEKTIEISCVSKNKILKSSSPSGKSKGIHEKKQYLNSIEKDIEIIKEFAEKICDTEINNFDDLEEIENLMSKKIGANSLFALESVLLKALANENKVEIWEILNNKAKKMPHPIGNCIGGGLHSKTQSGKKPDFQEFVFIPKTKKFEDDVLLLNRIHNICGVFLDLKKSKYGLNDENAWTTSLDNEEILSIISDVKEKIEEETKQEVQIGVDFASSSFYNKKFKSYLLKNNMKHLSKDKYKEMINEIIQKYSIYYNEDPLEEEDFDGFGDLLRNNPDSLIVGDDLTVTNPKRFLEAIRKKSINAIIIKPNQIGSLLEVKNIVNISKNFDIKTIFSHRSGETEDDFIADLAFAFESDYIKTGVLGKEREAKLKRLIQIERSL